MSTTTRGPASRTSGCRPSACHASGRCCRRATTPSESSGCATGWRRRAYDLVVVWADREHSAGMSFLTGFDPRFEEAILIVARDGEPAILVGNECWGTADAAPLPVRRHPVPGSEPAQPAAGSVAPAGGDPGRRRASVTGTRVGVVGWKTYARRSTLEAPAFLVDELRALVGPAGLVENARDLLIDPADGLRVVNDVDQLAAFEWAATPDLGRGPATARRPSAGDDRTRGRPAAASWNGTPAVVPPDADRRTTGATSACSVRAIGRSSAATRSRSPSASGAR